MAEALDVDLLVAVDRIRPRMAQSGAIENFNRRRVPVTHVV